MCIGWRAPLSPRIKGPSHSTTFVIGGRLGGVCAWMGGGGSFGGLICPGLGLVPLCGLDGAHKTPESRAVG